MQKIQHDLQLGDTTLIFIEYHKAPAGVFFVRVHGDELDAQTCGLWALEEFGGTFLDIQNPSRNISFDFKGKTIDFDPNRIFSSEGIYQDLSVNGCMASEAEALEVEKCSRFITTIAEPHPVIVALHNNVDFNIDYYSEGGECYGSAQQIHVEPSQHKNDLIIVTRPEDFEACRDKKLNVVLQSELQADHSGGMSEYCLRKSIRYFNVEYHAGHLSQQKEAIQDIVRIINPAYFS